MPFPPRVKNQALLWSDRHCCLCKKSCGPDIEVHHVQPQQKRGSNDITNAIPLCYDCHARVAHYNELHPRGSRFRTEELIQRREQVYEEFTAHLVPVVMYGVTQQQRQPTPRQLPNVGFSISHVAGAYPVRARVVVTVMRSRRRKQVLRKHYGGQKLWRLNPGFTLNGHMFIPDFRKSDERRLELEVQVSLVDIYNREHRHLPLGFVWMPDRKDWYLEP